MAGKTTDMGAFKMKTETQKLNLKPKKIDRDNTHFPDSTTYPSSSSSDYESDEEDVVIKTKTKTKTKTKPKKLQKNRILKSPLKDMNHLSTNNNMTITIDNLLGLDSENYLPFRLNYTHDKQKRPKLPFNNKSHAELVFGREFLDSYEDCPTWDSPLKSTLFKANHYDTIMKWYQSMPVEQQEKLNAFQKNLAVSKLGVIDADSKEAGEWVKSNFPNLPYTKSSGNLNKVKGKEGCLHFFFTKDNGDLDNYLTILAKRDLKYIEGQSEPKYNFDILLSTLLFESKSNVKNWNGKAPPTITMDEIQILTPVSFKSKKLTIQSIRENNEKICVEQIRDTIDSSTIFKQTSFNICQDMRVVIPLLDLYPNDKLLNNQGWSLILKVLKNQIVNEDTNRALKQLFQKKMKQVFDNFSKDGKVGNDTWTKWKNENEKEWKKPISESDKKIHIGILWKNAYKNHRKDWAMIKSEVGGLPDCVIMDDMKYYKDQKKYFEEYAYFVLLGKAPAIFITDKDEHNFFGGSLSKPEFRNHEWSSVSSYKQIAGKEADENGNPILEDKFVGNFAETWLNDPRKKKYDYNDFYPEGWQYLKDETLKARAESKRTVNIYNGMSVLKLAEDPEFVERCENRKKNDEEVYGDKYKSIEKLLELVFLLSGEDKLVYDYVMTFIAMTLVYPAIRPGIFLVFKSVPGVGKNLLWDWIGNVLIGKDYYMCSASKSAWFDKHSIDREYRILLFMNEMAPKDMIANLPQLKEQITDEWLVLNPKNEKMRSSRNVASQVGGTNLNFSVPVESGDRRMALIECSSGHRNIPGYFEEIVKSQQDKECQYLFFEYCRDIIKPNPHYNFEQNLPKTAYHGTIAEKCIPQKIKFFKWLVYQKHKGTYEVDELTSKVGKANFNASLYQQFRRWITENQEGSKEGYMKSFSAFEMEMKQHTLNMVSKSVKSGEAQLALNSEKNRDRFIIQNRKQNKALMKKVPTFHFDCERFYEFYACLQAKEHGKTYEEAKLEIMNYGRLDNAVDSEFLE